MNLETVDSSLAGSVTALATALGSVASPELAALLAWIGLSAALVGLYRLLGPSLAQIRLNQLVTARPSRPVVESPEQRIGSAAMVELLERRWARRRTITSLRMRLARAGLTITATEFLGFRLASALVAALIVGVALLPAIGWASLVVAIVAGMAGSLLPNAVLSVLIQRRMDALEKQIPDAIDVVASALQAGTGLAQGFALLSREMEPPVSQEFSLVQQEINVGLSLTEALTNLANRVASEELDLVVTCIIIQSRVGGNLVKILRTASAVIRERMELRGEIRVLTAQQRFSAFVIGIMPPGVAGILWLLSPQYMGGLLSPGITQYMLVAAVALQLAGMYLLAKFCQIEV